MMQCRFLNGIFLYRTVCCLLYQQVFFREWVKTKTTAGRGITICSNVLTYTTQLLLFYNVRLKKNHHMTCNIF